MTNDGNQDRNFDQFVQKEIDKIDISYDKQQWDLLQAKLEIFSKTQSPKKINPENNPIKWLKWGLITLVVTQIIIVSVVFILTKEPSTKQKAIEVPVKTQDVNQDETIDSKTKLLEKNPKKNQNSQYEYINDQKKSGAKKQENSLKIPLEEGQTIHFTKADSLLIDKSKKETKQDTIKKKKYIIW